MERLIVLRRGLDGAELGLRSGELPLSGGRGQGHWCPELERGLRWTLAEERDEDALDFHPLPRLWSLLAQSEDPLWPLFRSARRLLGRASGRRLVVSVTGCKAGSSRYNAALRARAELAGELAARAGCTVLTGGLSGVMSDAARGARRAGGESVGILPSEQHRDANPHLDLVLPSGIGYARNVLVANACDGMISLSGGTGTLEELCFALDARRAVLSWAGWSLEGVERVEEDDAESICLFLDQLCFQHLPGLALTPN
jgi:uncharacterized protein (TIGR00725 family)